MITALIYGESPINMIENLLSQPHIRELKNANHWFSCDFIISSSAQSASILTPGTGIIERNSNNTIRESVTKIFFFRDSDFQILFKYFQSINCF
jgi:hypothetical protein